MKKVGITTITGARSKGFNYGNILQNYALSFYIQKYLNNIFNFLQVVLLLIRIKHSKFV